MKADSGYYRSPIGWLEIRASRGAVELLRFVPASAVRAKRCGDFVRRCERALARYFGGQRLRLHLPFRSSGTRFERRVWRRAAAIRPGTTVSYGELARRVGAPRAARAVGAALRKNELLLLIPCHRVVKAGGRLGGFSCGIARKRWLLRHEGARLLAGHG